MEPAIGPEVLKEEFEAMFRDHYQLIYRTAYSVTGRRQDAEDVLQTLFVRLIERGIPAGSRQNPKSYLYRAGVNMALNTLRARKRENLEHELQGLQIPAHAEPSPTSDHLQQTLLAAIARLRPKAVEILILHYEYNYSDAEIAKMLGRHRAAS